MTTPDSFGSGGAMGTGGGGLAAGPGDGQGDDAVTREAQSGRGGSSGPGTGSVANKESAPGTEGGLATAGDTGPDLTEDDETSAADRG